MRRASLRAVGEALGPAAAAVRGRQPGRRAACGGGAAGEGLLGGGPRAAAEHGGGQAGRAGRGGGEEALQVSGLEARDSRGYPDIHVVYTVIQS